jgi:predicted phage-related endonuclease
MGIQVQDTVAMLAANQMGIKLRRDNRHYRMQGAGWMVCHLDYRELGDRKHLIEVKSVMSTDGYGEAGTEQVPIDYWVQCQHEMAVVRAERTSLAVLFGHYDFRVFTILRNQAFIDKLVEACRLFWFKNVLEGNVPPVSVGDGPLVERLHPEPTEPVISATTEQALLARGFKAAQANVKEAMDALDLVKTQLKDLIGEAEGLRGPGFLITWKKDKDQVETDWQLVAESYRKAIADTMSADDLDAIVSLYSQVKEGKRRFLMNWKESE